MTSIEWTDKSWNPWKGCSAVSPGCAHCYAEAMAKRLKGMGAPGYADVIGGNGRWSGKLKLAEKTLEAPLRWRKPSRVFVNSMSDFFHEDAPDSWRDRAFAVMTLASRHTFQILTKRADLMRGYFEKPGRSDLIRQCARLTAPEWPSDFPWPLPNVWLGVSVEDQRRADERVPQLLATPAAVRWLSCEPLLVPVDLTPWIGPWRDCDYFAARPSAIQLREGIITCSRPENSSGKCQKGWCPFGFIGGIDWVVVGGESGHLARGMNVEWARSIVRQCREAKVPVFVKQLGARPFFVAPNGEPTPWIMNKGNRKGEWSEYWPEELRVREWPGGGE